MSYDSTVWLPLTAGLTLLGLVLSYIVYQRRGLRPALLGVAWSLLPIAAYLTGATEMLWKIGEAISKFATGFVFSPEKWAGIGVTALAIALFLAAGGRQRRKAAREARKAARADEKNAAGSAAGAPEIAPRKRPQDPMSTAVTQDFRTPVPAARPAKQAPARQAQGKPAKSASHDDDDMRDIEDILRKRGI
jgi:hypothetical protein